MTYKQLLEELQELPPERLEDIVTVHDPYEDRMIAVVYTGTAEEDDCDVLDPGHFFLVLKA
jgi:hypothetical protein